MTHYVAVFPVLSILSQEAALRADAYRIATEISAIGTGISLPTLKGQGTYTADVELYSHHDSRFPVPKRDRKLAYLGAAGRDSLRNWLVAKISVSIALRAGNWTSHRDGRTTTVPEEQALHFTESVTAHLLERQIFDLCCIANLASPGAFNIGAPFIYQDGQLVHTGKAVISDVESARAYAQKTGWPTIRSLPVLDVWNWVYTLNLPERLGDTAVSRAYNAWTYQFGEPGAGDPLQLFWALMGVEALFNDGRESVREQVLRRSQLLLGERRTHKADVGEMNRLRSAFVHGGLPFPSKDYPFDAHPEFEAYNERIWGATSIAQAMLVASLQTLVRENWSAISVGSILHGVAVESHPSASDT